MARFKKIQALAIRVVAWLPAAWLTAAWLTAAWLTAADISAATAEEKTAWPSPDWETASAASQGMDSTSLEKLRTWLADKGSKTGLVVRHGRIVAEWYFDDAKADAKYLVYSTTKSFASTAVGMAIDEGKLSLDTKLGDLLENVQPQEKKQVTVRQMISMTTGIHNEGSLNEKQDLFTYALTQAPMDNRPGEKWDYNNTGLAVLAPAFAKAVGKPLDAYLAERMFEPIGIGKDDWSWDQRENMPLSYTGLHITARALARFGLLALHDGKWADKQVLAKGWIGKATAPSQDLNKGYGYLWWNNTKGDWSGVPADAYAALGRFDNDMLVVPSLDLIMIRQIGVDSNDKRQLDKAEMFRLAVESVKDEAKR